MQIILPKFGAAFEPHQSLFFLAGPVRGGGDWHQQMVHELSIRNSECVIAIPTRYSNDHPLMPYRLQKAEEYERQLDWERAYLERAAWDGYGCIIFWLGTQKEPRSKKDGPYAQDTYGEIGRWAVHKKYRPKTRMVVGAEPRFHGLSQIHRNLEKDLEHEFPIHPTIRETAIAALKLART